MIMYRSCYYGNVRVKMDCSLVKLLVFRILFVLQFTNVYGNTRYLPIRLRVQYLKITLNVDGVDRLRDIA